jgi:hypothetical protein
VLRALRDLSPDDAELIYAKRGGYWIGTRRISARTADQLPQLYLVRVAYGRIDDYCQFVITPDGRKLLEIPTTFQRLPKPSAPNLRTTKSPAGLL